MLPKIAPVPLLFVVVVLFAAFTFDDDVIALPLFAAPIVDLSVA